MVGERAQLNMTLPLSADVLVLFAVKDISNPGFVVVVVFGLALAVCNMLGLQYHTFTMDLLAVSPLDTTDGTQCCLYRCPTLQ